MIPLQLPAEPADRATDRPHNPAAASWASFTAHLGREPPGSVTRPAPAALAATPTLAAAPPEPSDIRILVVEDNLTNQVVARQLLKQMGYWADVVANGREALHALNRSLYHLVLMDRQMPEMNGYEATRQIRAGAAGPARAQIHIIAMTANAMRATARAVSRPA